MIEYFIGGKKYMLHYQELRESYLGFCQMTDDEFMKNLASAAHLACVICYLKETPGYVALSDEGIVHQLIHLMHIPNYRKGNIKDIRRLFKTTLQLV